LSRHRKIPHSRSKVIAVVAAGAFTVVTAASATAATWPQDSSASSARGTHDALAGPGLGTGLIVKGHLVQAHAAAQTAANQALRVFQVQDIQGELAAARRQAVQPRAAHAVKKAPAAPAPSGSPRQIAEAMLGSFGWSSGQFSCLDPLWAHESGWGVTAYNAGSGAYGIPQALPGSRMASAGPDWQANAATQIRWGLKYIKGTYRSPCGAWDHELATGWY
jgi:hypothetical protein